MTTDELERIYNFLKRFFLGLIKQVKIDELIYYIKNNKAPNLTLYFNMIPKKVIKNLKNLKKSNPEIVEKYINSEQILKYCQEEIPEMHTVFSTIKGRKWLDVFVKYILKSLF